MYPQQYATQAPIKPKKRKQITFILMIIAGVGLLIGAIAWIVLAMRSSSDTGKTPMQMASVLEPDGAAPIPQKVESMLGVTVAYNARELAAFGFSGETTYSADELDEKRPYSVIRVRPVETSRAAHSEVTLTSPELRVTSTSDANYWRQFEEKETDAKSSSKVEKLIKATTDQRTKNTSVSASDSEKKVINKVEYSKVTYTHKDERFGVTSTRREECYFTVQNDRPYIACINNIRASNFSVVAQLEQVVDAITYQKPEVNGLAVVDSDAEKAALIDNRLDEVVTEKPKEEETAKEETKSPKKPKEKKTPAYIENTRDFYAFAQNVPATVRTGMIYCADIRLTLPTGSPGPQLTGACVDKAGTGFFVTTEGLLATAATSIDVTPREAIRAYLTNAPDDSQTRSRLERVLEYLFQARVLMQTDVDAILAGVAERDQDVIEKVYMLADLIAPQHIALTKEEYSYAVQTSNKPIIVNKKGNGALEFAFSDSILKADLVGKKYSNDKMQNQIAAGETVDDDVALLKVSKGGNYPIVHLAPSSNVAKGGTVGIIGMPMYAVGSLLSGQFRATPLLRQGKADQVFNGASGQRLLVVTTSSHAGFTGAPAIDANGQVVGYATYNTANCPGGACMGSTVIRDIAEIKTLARDRNQSVRSVSVSSDAWSTALRELIRGNYSQSIDFFNEALQQYPQNYLAKPFAEYAKSQLGKPTDTSLINTGILASQITVIVSAISLVILLIIRLAKRLFSRPQAVSQYGVAAGGQYVDPKSWGQQQGQSYTPTSVAASPTSPVYTQSAGQQYRGGQASVVSPTPQMPPVQQPPQQSARDYYASLSQAAPTSPVNNQPVLPQPYQQPPSYTQQGNPNQPDQNPPAGQ